MFRQFQPGAAFRASAPATTAVERGPSGVFFKDTFTGSSGVSLANRSGEVGTLFAPPGELDFLTQGAANDSLSAAILDGSGGFKYKATAAYEWRAALLRLPAPTSKGYYVQVQVDVAPAYDKNITVYLIGRSRNQSGTTALGGVGVKFTGRGGDHFRAESWSNGDTDGDIIWDSSAYYTGASHTVTFRLELVSNLRRIKFLGPLSTPVVVTDWQTVSEGVIDGVSGLQYPGDVYVGFEQQNLPGGIFSVTGDYFNGRVLSIEAGELNYVTEDVQTFGITDATEVRSSTNLAETGTFTDGVEYAHAYVLNEHGTFSEAVSQAGSTLSNTVGEDVRAATALASVVTTLANQAGTFTDQQELARASVIATDTCTFSEATVQTGVYVNNAVEVGSFREATALARSAVLADTGTFTGAAELSVASKLVETGTISAVAVITGTFVNNTVEAATITGVEQVGPITTTAETGTLTAAAVGSSTFANNVGETGTFTDATAVSAAATTTVAEVGTFSEANANTLVGYSVLGDSLFLTDATKGGGDPGAWTAHLETFAMSRYTAFPFNSIAEVDGVLVGCGEDAVYRLDADDDDGDPIDASVIHDWTDRVANRGGEMAPTPNFKQPRAFYASGTTDGQVSVSVSYVVNGVEATTAYDLPLRTQVGFVTNRVPLGRGIRSRYLGFTISNKNGSSMVLNDAHADVDLSERTV